MFDVIIESKHIELTELQLRFLSKHSKFINKFIILINSNDALIDFKLKLLKHQINIDFEIIPYSKLVNKNLFNFIDSNFNENKKYLFVSAFVSYFEQSFLDTLNQELEQDNSRLYFPQILNTERVFYIHQVMGIHKSFTNGRWNNDYLDSEELLDFNNWDKNFLLNLSKKYLTMIKLGSVDRLKFDKYHFLPNEILPLYCFCWENNLLINDPNSPNNQAPFNVLGTLLGLRYIIDRTSGRSIFAQDQSIAGTTPYTFDIIANVGLNINTMIVDESFERSLMLRLGWILGYRAAKYSNSTTSSAGGFGSIVSEGICFPLYGYLSIDDFNKNANDYFMTVFANSISLPNIISRINFTQFFQAVGAFQAAQGESTSNAINREKRFFGPVTIQKLKITLYDDLGRVLDLNNMDWALELAFECVYSM